MPAVMLLTAAQAAQIQGAGTSIAMLQPEPLSDGRFILGAETMNNPVDVADRDFLAGLPTCERTDIAHLLPGGSP